MQMYRFGRKISLPSTTAIKHQIRKLMAQEKAEIEGIRKRTEGQKREPGAPEVLALSPL
jgi:hypothetical protein